MTIQNFDGCALCMVINKKLYRELHEHGVVFEPDNKVVDGHLIVAPLVHIKDATINPVITAQVMRLAAMKAKGQCSILTAVGEESGQRGDHMYVHIIPSTAGAPRFASPKRKGISYDGKS